MTTAPAVDGLLAHLPDTAPFDALSRIRHEIARRHRRATMTSQTHKVCPTCNEAKLHAAYRRDASRADGLDALCRACRASR